MCAKLLTPDNFSLKEYLNEGSRSVVSPGDRKLIIAEWNKLSLSERQRCLSILFALQPYRGELGFSIFITCGFRSREHELRKGRNGTSQHQFFAVDLTCNTMVELDRLADLLERTWVGGFKYYRDRRFIHIDLGPNRRW